MKLIDIIKNGDVNNHYRKLNNKNLYEVNEYQTYLFEARGVKRLEKHAENGFFLVSAFREYNDNNKNLQLHNTLKTYLKSNKLGYWEVDGMYDYGDGNPTAELTCLVPYNSIYTPDEFLDIATNLRSTYNQDSVLFWQPELGAYLLYKDRQDFIAENITFDKLVKIYTKFKTGKDKGRIFTFEGVRIPSNHISAMSMENEGHII